MSWLPEDRSTGPGYWIFKWPLKVSQCLKDAVSWHDSATSKASSQAKAGIEGNRVDSTFKDQLDLCAKETKEHLTVRIWKGIITAFGRFFTEGTYFKKD